MIHITFTEKNGQRTIVRFSSHEEREEYLMNETEYCFKENKKWLNSKTLKENEKVRKKLLAKRIKFIRSLGYTLKGNEYIKE